MPVVISNTYGSRLPLSQEKISRIADKLLREMGCAGHTLSLLLTDDAGIRRLNRDYRHIDKATNVLSFPFADGIGEELSSLPVRELGDVVISLDTAAKEAEEYNQRLVYRVAWLTAHGLLHLLGYDHERSEKDAELMLEQEETLLKNVFINRSRTMPQLAINVDHVATIRQARGGREPDPVLAASLCELAGASGIVVHLREDRRHIQDSDVYLLRKTVKTRLNLEMGANREIIDIALDVVPDMITLVPEKRQELTTEGGLDVISQKKKLAKVVSTFDKAGIPVSIFVDPDSDQIRASNDIGAKYVEIHTGRYCDALNEEQRDQEFYFIVDAAEEAHQLGLVVNAGHGLDYRNAARIAALDTIDELSIGHAVISRAVFTGIERAVKDMQSIIENAQRLEL